MKILYSFSSSHGDVIVDDATLARPFIVRPFENHPFMTLGDYFLAIRDFILRENGQSLSTLLSRLWEHNAEIDFHGHVRENLSSEHGEREGEAPAALPMEGATRAPIVDAITIRYEKYGTLYHISSVEVLAGERPVRLAVSVAITAESKEALDHEFDLLRQLGHQSKLSHLPQAYCKHTVYVQKGEGSETLLMTLSEWFENYHEWHFSRDEEGRERIVIWDMKGGYRLASEQEAYEIIRQASTILSSYYNTETYHRIFPWHHGAGDFVVKAAEGVVDVKLITARGYEPIAFPEQDRKIGPAPALILFFLETTIKMRLDKWEGMGESTWADATVVGAATKGFLQTLRARELKGDTGITKFDDFVKQLKSFTEEELKILLRSRMDEYRAHDPSDYRVMLSRVDDHACDVYRAIQEQVKTTKAG